MRHALLNYEKHCFPDCTTHRGKTYSNHEEAVLATGHFCHKDEATRVLEEMIDMHYTTAQLRFAFILLVEQDARPRTMLQKFEKQLSHDFVQRKHRVRKACLLLYNAVVPMCR
jgi:hypothetical protein